MNIATHAGFSPIEHERALPAGDTRKHWWTYADLAVIFGTTQVRRLMPQWEREGFPAPMPFCRREKRWNPGAVLRWKFRAEVKHGSVQEAGR